MELSNAVEKNGTLEKKLAIEKKSTLNLLTFFSSLKS